MMIISSLLCLVIPETNCYASRMVVGSNTMTEEQQPDWTSLILAVICPSKKLDKLDLCRHLFKQKIGQACSLPSSTQAKDWTSMITAVICPCKRLGKLVLCLICPSKRLEKLDLCLICPSKFSMWSPTNQIDSYCRNLLNDRIIFQ